MCFHMYAVEHQQTQLKKHKAIFPKNLGVLNFGPDFRTSGHQTNKSIALGKQEKSHIALPGGSSSWSAWVSHSLASSTPS